MRNCICNNCGMEFQVERLDLEKDTLQNGNEVEILSFTCPKCDEKYIISVRDNHSAELQKELQAAKDVYAKSYDESDKDTEYQARKEVGYRKRQLYAYMESLKKKYLKELRKRG